MKTNTTEGALILEGSAELQAAILVCTTPRPADGHTRDRAQWVTEAASRADVMGARVGNPGRVLPLTRQDALIVTAAARAYTPPKHRPALRGDAQIAAAVRELANTQP